jgi:hypothetical protein
MNIQDSVFFPLTCIASLALLFSGLAARKNERKKPAWASLTLMGVCGIIWNFFAILHSIFNITNWAFQLTRQLMIGIMVGIYLSMLVSGQFKVFRKKCEINERSDR